MAKQNFAMGLGKKINGNAGDELRKIEASKSGYTFKIVPYDEIRPSDSNKYPINSVIEIKESISQYGLLHNLVLMPVEDDSNYKYEIKSGEQRYLAIGMLLDEGNEDFIVGIPSRVLDKNTSDLDQQIILEEANIKQRSYDPETMRAAVERLRELYKKKNIKEDLNISVTKQVAKTAGIGERQVQRYNAVNDKLIPELQEAFDKSAISLEKAAQFASLDEDTQHLVVELLKSNKNISKNEIELVKKAALEKEELLEKQLKEKEIKLTEIEKKYYEVNNEKVKIEEDLLNKEMALEENSNREKEIRKEIEEELKSNDPNIKLLEELKISLDQLNKEKENALKTTAILEKKLSEKDNELNNTKKELNEIRDLEKKPSEIILSDAEKKKLTDSFELVNLMNDINKNFIQFMVKNETYISNYREIPDEIFNNYKSLEKLIEEGKDKMFNNQ